MHKANIDEGKNSQNELSNAHFRIEDRRRQVASLVAQSMTQEEIAQRLNVDRTTVSRDITALKESSQRFIYDLAKSDLAYSYKQCIVWEMLRSGKLSSKDKLQALKLAKECNESQFSLFNNGPQVMNVKVLEERLNKIENR